MRFESNESLTDAKAAARLFKDTFFTEDLRTTTSANFFLKTLLETWKKFVDGKCLIHYR